MFLQEVNITPFFEAAGVKPGPKLGKISLSNRMEPPEKDPLNDWLYLELLALKDIAKERKVRKAACIGTGRGIDAIAVSHIFHPKKLYVTDLVGELLPLAEQNIEENIQPDRRPKKIAYLAGKDCEPLPEKVDLITFSPPPLMAYDHPAIDAGIARTTIIEAEPYLALTSGKNDIRLKWSTLPQYQFLLSAKEKLSPDGTVLTLYTGRIPFEATEAAYRDAGFTLKIRYQAIKMQTDPQYLKEYAIYEKERLDGDSFYFFDVEKAQKILSAHGIQVPGLVSGHDDASIKDLLKDARISAQQAYKIFLKGKNVAHIAYALEGRLR